MVVIGHALVDDEDFERINALWPGYHWRLSHKGYAIKQTTRNGRAQTLWMHREALGAPPGVGVDHKDGNKIDNRKSNLRLASQSPNLQNAVHFKEGTSSGIRGVSLHKATGKWAAYAKLNYRKHHIGYYDSIAEAEAAVLVFREQHMPYWNPERALKQPIGA